MTLLAKARAYHLSQIGVDLQGIEIVKGPLKRDKRLTVRVPETVLERLRIVALADGRSISDWALRAIEREIDHAEAQRQNELECVARACIVEPYQHSHGRQPAAHISLNCDCDDGGHVSVHDSTGQAATGVCKHCERPA